VPVGRQNVVKEEVLDFQEHFDRGDVIYKYLYNDNECCDVTEAVNCARSQIGVYNYDLLRANCEQTDNIRKVVDAV